VLQELRRAAKVGRVGIQHPRILLAKPDGEWAMRDIIGFGDCGSVEAGRLGK